MDESVIYDGSESKLGIVNGLYRRIWRGTDASSVANVARSTMERDDENTHHTTENAMVLLKVRNHM